MLLISKIQKSRRFSEENLLNKKEVHYLMPLRVMGYDADEYEWQAAEIKKKVRSQKGLSRSEFLSGFGKDSRLHPCVTLVLYYGEEWDEADI